MLLASMHIKCSVTYRLQMEEESRTFNLSNFVLQIWNVVSAQWGMKPKLTQFSLVVFCSTVTEKFLL